VCVLEKVSFSAGIKDTELLLRGRTGWLLLPQQMAVMELRKMAQKGFFSLVFVQWHIHTVDRVVFCLVLFAPLPGKSTQTPRVLTIMSAISGRA